MELDDGLAFDKLGWYKGPRTFGVCVGSLKGEKRALWGGRKEESLLPALEGLKDLEKGWVSRWSRAPEFPVLSDFVQGWASCLSEGWWDLTSPSKTLGRVWSMDPSSKGVTLLSRW